MSASSGNIKVGFARTGDASGLSGSGLLLTLEMIGENVAGERAIEFSDMKAIDDNGEEIPADWLGGTVEVILP